MVGRQFELDVPSARVEVGEPAGGDISIGGKDGVATEVGVDVPGFCFAGGDSLFVGGDIGIVGLGGGEVKLGGFEFEEQGVEVGL